MKTIDMVKRKINALTSDLLPRQEKNGSWNFCFEGSIMTDAYMIILIRVLNISDEEGLVKKLVERIKSNDVVVIQQVIDFGRVTENHINTRYY